MRFGPYEVVRELARGGMGAVYAVVHVETGAGYALKTLLPEALGNTEERARFLREARALAQIQHPNLVRVFSAESEGARPYLVQEFVSGGSLQDRLSRQGALPREEAIALALQVGGALVAAHAQGILHRDLKPANVLVAEDGSARLADFGLAKRLNGESVRLTKTGALLGTPAYMAPEQANGATCDERADVYGLAAVLHALLLGAPPFEASSLVGVLGKVMTEPPTPLVDQPRGLRGVLARAMAKDPRDRPRTMQAFLEEVGAAARAPERGARVLGGIVALGVLSLVTLATVLTQGERGAEDRPQQTRPSAQATPSLSPAAATPQRSEAPLERAPRAPILLPPGRPERVTYSPDARFLLVRVQSEEDSGRLVVFDARTGQRLISEEFAKVRQATFVPGEPIRALVGSEGAGLRLWGAADRSEGQRPRGRLVSLSASPDGRHALASHEEPNVLSLWSLGSQITLQDGRTGGGVWDLVAFSEVGALAFRRGEVQALSLDPFGPTGPNLRLPKSLPAVVEVAQGHAYLGSAPGELLEIQLDDEGLPRGLKHLDRKHGSFGLKAHLGEIHTIFLPSEDTLVSVAQSTNDPVRRAAVTEWQRSAEGKWSVKRDHRVDPNQVCVAAGGADRHWVALVTLSPNARAGVLKQVSVERYLKR